jgi:hypothetical protein
MSPAPAWLLSSQALAAAVAAWRAHHEACPQCGAHDWYNPGVPLIARSPRPNWYKVETRTGAVWMTAQPDPGVLCRSGKQLFNRWCLLAARGGSLDLERDA